LIGAKRSDQFFHFHFYDDAIRILLMRNIYYFINQIEKSLLFFCADIFQEGQSTRLGGEIISNQGLESDGKITSSERFVL